MNFRFLKKFIFTGGVCLFFISPLRAEVVFEDIFERPGPLGWSAWDVWTRGSASVSQQDGGLVFGRKSTAFAQAAVQSRCTVDVGAYSSVVFSFRVHDFGGDTWGQGIKGGKTSFIVAGHDDSLDSLYSKSGVEGIVFSVEHQSIGHEGKPVVPVEILSTDGVLLGRVQVQSVNNFCLVVTVAADRWSVNVEGADFSVTAGAVEGPVGAWGRNACVRIESWCVAGDTGFGPASVDAVSIDVVP